MAVGHFQHGFITKGDGIKYVVRNGTDTFYIFCLPDSDQRWCGASVPIGFGPWGDFRMAWGNPLGWGNFWVPGVRNNVRPVRLTAAFLVSQLAVADRLGSSRDMS